MLSWPAGSTASDTHLPDTSGDRRAPQTPDRRAFPRGGRRPYDRPGRHPNLLVADSYDGARIPCARYLDHFGFQVEQAVNDGGAAAALQTRTPQVLLIDASIPQTSEGGLIEWLDRAGAQHIPVIVMLSDFDEETPRRLPPAAAVLVKPFPLSTMLQEVRRALRAEVKTPGRSLANRPQH